MSDEFQTERKRRKIEVKVGSGTLIVEESELDNLIDALSDMRKTATDGKEFRLRNDQPNKSTRN